MIVLPSLSIHRFGPQLIPTGIEKSHLNAHLVGFFVTHFALFQEPSPFLQDCGNAPLL